MAQHTYKGKTAGGWLRHAYVARMQAGTHEVLIKDLPGHLCMLAESSDTGECFMVISNYVDSLTLSLSPRAENILKALISIADKRTGEEASR